MAGHPEARAEELPAVAALRTLSIFGADQSGAYREHFERVAEALGDDIPTKLAEHAASWGAGEEPGALILTGNAGTGKTAVADAWCRAVGAELPTSDEAREMPGGQLVIKDLSGIPGGSARTEAVRKVIVVAASAQALMCANEGVLRDAGNALEGDGEELRRLLDHALREGAASTGGITVVNVNRQRPTAEALWERLLDFVAREELWEPGCQDCPADGPGATGCPFRANAAALRRPNPRAALRQLVRLGAGEAVPTMREILAILSWAIVGGSSCPKAKDQARHRGNSAHTAEAAYFHRAVGGGLHRDQLERSPLLMGMRAAALGETSDLQIDEWLRDAGSAPPAVQALAGMPDPHAASGAHGEPDDDELGAAPAGPLAGSRGPHDRVTTGLGAMTFYALGETVSTSENPTEVDECLRALVGSEGGPPRLALWRRRAFFEAPDALGGRDAATARLLDARYLAQFLDLAEAVAAEEDNWLALNQIVSGLNFLVCGFSSASEGLIVPDQACLFARDPGSFRPARPSLVIGTVPVDSVSLQCPDRGLVEELLDIDRVEIELVALGKPDLLLRVRPRLYEAIREAEAFQGPVGQGTAEMTDVRGFYGRLAGELGAGEQLRVADPATTPPSLQTITLPHFA